MPESASVLALARIGMVAGAGIHGMVTVVSAAGIIPSMPAAGMVSATAATGTGIMQGSRAAEVSEAAMLLMARARVLV